MRPSRLLSGLLSAAFVAACTSSPQPPSALSRPVPIPSPTSLAIPSPTVPFHRCDTKDLEMRFVFLGVGLGNVGGYIEVRNASSRDCDLYGYAGVQLLNARGRPVQTDAVRSNSSYIFGANQVEEVIGLPAGTVRITAERPVPGHAYIPISWNDVQEPCSQAAQLKVTPPGSASSLTISLLSGGAPAGLMSFCSGGQVIVNPVRAAFYQ